MNIFLLDELNVLSNLIENLKLNHIVCHHQKGGDCWNKNLFYGFDDTN